MCCLKVSKVCSMLYRYWQICSITRMIVFGELSWTWLPMTNIIALPEACSTNFGSGNQVITIMSLLSNVISASFWREHCILALDSANTNSIIHLWSVVFKCWLEHSTSLAHQVLPDVSRLLSFQSGNTNSYSEIMTSACYTLRNLIMSNPHLGKSYLTSNMLNNVVSLCRNGWVWGRKLVQRRFWAHPLSAKPD